MTIETNPDAIPAETLNDTLNEVLGSPPKPALNPNKVVLNIVAFIALIIANIVLLGIVAPTLISAASWPAFILGVVLMLTTILTDIWLIISATAKKTK